MARGSFARRIVFAGAVVLIARWAVSPAETKPVPVEAPEDVPEAAHAPRRPARKRFATSLALVALFVAGGALSAGAGNELAHVDAASTDPAAVAAAVPVADPTADAASAADAEPATTDEAAPADSDAVAVAAPTDAAPAAAPAAAPETAPAPAPAPAAPAAPADQPDALVVTSAAPAVAQSAPAPAVKPARHEAARRRVHRLAAQAAPPAPVATAPIPYRALAFDPQAWLHANTASPTGAAAVGIAEHYLGVPYRWGGAAPSTGFDCSGLMQFVYAQLGVSLPHYAAAQFAEFPKLDPTQLQPGDLVFFEPKVDGPGHVALYLGNDQILEAPHTGALVRVNSLSGEAAQLGFLGAVRPYSVAPAAPVAAVAPVRSSPVGLVSLRLA
jgi:peptidoglycan DL-endopeptidase CwlO